MENTKNLIKLQLYEWIKNNTKKALELGIIKRENSRGQND